MTLDSDEELHTFDGNSVYIIGGLMNMNEKISIKRAKELGIGHAKFPLKKYIG